MRKGLDNSIWASRAGVGEQCARRADWQCSTCRGSNYWWRTECYRCKSSNLPGAGTNTYQPPIRPVAIATYPTTDSAQSFHPNTRESYAIPIANATDHNKTSGQNAGVGLATSRWAPRNSLEYGQPVSSSDVWIRIDRSVDAPLQPLQGSLAAGARDLDFGLPFQVQHYVLTTIQRILEEACFEFASRWTSQEVAVQGWDCAEAVELSKWKDFLPAKLPPNAIKQIPNYSLAQGMIDAVRIRNAAVHKHLCNNTELQFMTAQAQKLMIMFGDVSRYNKFHDLEFELGTWDSRSREDSYSARTKLEQALREIGERPLDDMDWTPNSISLQEVQDRDARVIGAESAISYELGDAMEVEIY